MPSVPPFESPTVSTAAPAWRLEGHRLFDGRASKAATIDLDAPGTGVLLGDAAASAADRLLGLDPERPWRLVDHWPRGSDLTAVYESDDDRRLRASIMWRLHPCGDGIRGWQAVVSAQTSLLQSDPLLAVTSTLADGPGDAWLWGVCRGGTIHWQEAATADATCVLLRRTAGDRESVLVAGHPGEVRGIEPRALGGRTTISCWLFPIALEKGVLLRSRVLAAVGPAHGDVAWATSTAAAFAALPPLLTT